jgi:hypothetical protein
MHGDPIIRYFYQKVNDIYQIFDKLIKICYHFIMKQEIREWPIIVEICAAIARRDVEKAYNYAVLLADKVDEAGEASLASLLRRKLQAASPRANGDAAATKLSPAAVALAPSPADAESRHHLLDEITEPRTATPVLAEGVLFEIERFIRLRQKADQFLREGIPIPRSLLLYGPPGCGKSTITYYIAHQLNYPLLQVRLDAVMSSYLGSTAKNVRAAFEHADKRGGILFLDEFDALAKMRDDANEVGEIKRIVNSLIQNLDAFPDICVIAATNHEHLLDPAIWRRFDSVTRVPLPGLRERQQLFAQFAGNIPVEPELLEILAHLTEGFTGADIEQVTLRARQEHVLNANTSLLPLITNEVWRLVEHKDPERQQRSGDEKDALVAFIDAHTTKISARALNLLTAIPGPSIAHIRRRNRRGESLD